MTTTSRQEYSLDQAEFARTLRLGLGRAVLFLQQNDSAPYRDIIVRACLDNDVFDYQVNYDRQQYLFDVVSASSETSSIRRHLIDALPHISDVEDGWMLAVLIRMFAEGGDLEARAALLESVELELADHPGLDEIVKLDGLDGLLFVADRLGDRGFTGSDHCDADTVVETAIERYGSDVVWQALDDARRTIRSVALFTHLARERQIRWSARGIHPREDPSGIRFDDLRMAIDKAVETGIYPSVFVNGWGRVASDPEILEAARQLLTIRDDDFKRLVFYLKVFHWRAFPLDHAPLLRLTAHPDGEVRNWAITALEHIHHEDVRARGVELMTSEDAWLRRRSLDLVNTFPLPEDYLLVESMLAKELNDEALHGIGQSVLEVATSTESRDWIGALLVLYERGPCAMCRSSVVNQLVSLEALPEHIAAECLFDSSLRIRDAVREFLGSS